MIFRDEFVDTDQRYLLSFLGALFMQHMAHFLCHYYTTKRPLCVEFIDFPALLYDKIRDLSLGLCLQSEGAFYAPSFINTGNHRSSGSCSDRIYAGILIHR